MKNKLLNVFFAIPLVGAVLALLAMAVYACVEAPLFTIWIAYIFWLIFALDHFVKKEWRIFQ